MTSTGSQQRAPFPSNPEEFDNDERISYSKVAETYVLEDETGSEWEWSSKVNKWVPVTDEALLAQQQSIYKIEGVDEDAPAMDPKKRKAADGDNGNASKAAKKQKPEQPPKNKAIYITSLPEDTDMEEIQQTFSKYGVIAESLDGDAPRIKLYYDENGKFKGEALVVYFRPESVDLAVTMLDGVDFRMGQTLPTGPMRVVPADQSFKSQKDQPAGEDAKKKGTTANRDRQKAMKKNEEMNRKLADWDDDDPQVIPNTSSRHDKVVVIKHMFTLKSLADEPEAIMDIKASYSVAYLTKIYADDKQEDIRDDGEKYGQITNVVVYDKEDDGVVTVRFSDATAAKNYAKATNGRAYDGRWLKASVADGSERYKKSSKYDTDDADEEARLQKYREELDE
ncbi:RNA recognition motif (aka RRM, RBD, or RNP domain) [Teratosphaeria destructans]|uniref:RNA recognition motif (Aka RRM, RBD, or RNP domain) n=1 Tax=Teratosphaeria destructans TaxID=418781 RepID=A0A9W7VY52_9PEZI|nr:RNA recognition motif (aka RRM, RBD, or RNP domain) [Teratosphaeria destructans]